MSLFYLTPSIWHCQDSNAKFSRKLQAMQKDNLTLLRRELAHVRSSGRLSFYRATARDRVSFACEVAWLIVFRRRCAILGVPRQIHGVPPMQRFSLFFPLSVVYFTRFTPLISLISSNNAPQSNSFFYINAPALLLEQPLFVLMQLFFTFTPI